MALLRYDLNLLRRDANRKGLIASVRLNGTSDIPWERFHRDILDEFSDVQFHDYTKLYRRMMEFLAGEIDGDEWPHNYHLTFSMSEGNEEQAKSVLSAGGTVAVVFESEFPATYLGHRVINGDEHDFRPLDDPGVVVGLSAKGSAKTDQTGFVKRPFQTAA